MKEKRGARKQETPVLRADNRTGEWDMRFVRRKSSMHEM